MWELKVHPDSFNNKLMLVMKSEYEYKLFSSFTIIII